MMLSMIYQQPRSPSKSRKPSDGKHRRADLLLERMRQVVESREDPPPPPIPLIPQTQQMQQMPRADKDGRYVSKLEVTCVKCYLARNRIIFKCILADRADARSREG